MSTETTRSPGAMTDRGRHERTTTRRRTETKHSTKTSEMYAYVAATLGVLIAGLVTKAATAPTIASRRTTSGSS